MLDFDATFQRCLFHQGAADTPVCLSLALCGSQGASSGPGSGWALGIISLSPPPHLQLGEWGPERPGDWAGPHSLVAAELGLGQACLSDCASVLQAFQGARKHVHLRSVRGTHWLPR